MKKDVCITIKSIQAYTNDREETELTTLGEFAKENGIYELTYEDSEATGFSGSSTKLCVERENKVTLTRSGAANSNLIIENQKKHHCLYGTPYGDFIVGVNTEKIESSLNDNGGDLYFKYTIDINSVFMSDNEIFIKIEETKSETELN